MKYLKKKLNSQSGVTILFALLAFTVAAMVSITIVTAANSMVRRVQNDRKEQRVRLALTSAANLVKKEISKTSYTVEKVDDHYYEVDKKGVFQEEVKRAVDQLIVHQMAADYIYEEKNSFTIDADHIEENVMVSFQMNQEYDIIFTLQIKEEGDTTGETLYVTANGYPPQYNKENFSWEGKNVTQTKPEGLE